MGNGSSSLSLSRTGIRRSPSRGLPVSRRYSPRQAEFRPRSRAVQRLSDTEFQVRLFSSLQLMVAPPACEPGQDTPAIFLSRLNRLAPGQPPLLAARSPDATGLASSLIDCFFSQSSGAIFNIASLRKFFTRPAQPSWPSRCMHSFCSLFSVFNLADSLFYFEFRRDAHTVLIRSSNHSLSWQLRFIQTRNLPELLHSTRSGF